MAKAYYQRLKVAAIQIESSLNVDQNIACCEAYIYDAASDGADICVLPELFACLGPEKDCSQLIESSTGRLCEWGANIAKRMGCFLVMGSFLEKSRRPSSRRSIECNLDGDCSSSSDGDSADGLRCINAEIKADPARLAAIQAKKNLPYNTCCVFSPTGDMVSRYRKIHLFDSNVSGAKGKESSWVRPGTKVATCQLDNFWTLGLGICYDLRFPEHFRDLQNRGVNFIALPAAFTDETGRDHWEVLLRARAIENQAYVVAANQCGTSGVRRYGHSMIVDPWGTVIAQASYNPGVVMAEISLDYVSSVRRSFPQ